MSSVFWKGRTVFVTGGTGFVGVWLTRELVREGARVFALVRDPSHGSRVTSESGDIRTVHGTVADYEVLHRAFCDHSIDTVFHLAAQSLVRVAQVDPAGTLETNVRGTWNVLEAARNSPVRSVVVASSDKAYGHSDSLPYTESQPMAGEFPYDVSKSCADLIARMYARSYGMAIATARFANVFGGGDLNFSRMIPGIIRSTLAGERFVIRGDGRSVRDFLYVEDGARAYMLLAEKIAENAAFGGRAYNFSLELRMSTLEIVGRVLQMMGRTDLQPIIRGEESSELREQFMSCEKSRGELGWSPRFTLAEGLEKAVAWYSDHFGRQGQRSNVPGQVFQVAAL